MCSSKRGYNSDRDRKKVFKSGVAEVFHVWEMHLQQKSLGGTEILFKIGDVHL